MGSDLIPEIIFIHRSNFIPPHFLTTFDQTFIVNEGFCGRKILMANLYKLQQENKHRYCQIQFFPVGKYKKHQIQQKGKIYRRNNQIDYFIKIPTQACLKLNRLWMHSLSISTEGDILYFGIKAIIKDKNKIVIYSKFSRLFYTHLKYHRNPGSVILYHPTGVNLFSSCGHIYYNFL